MRKHYGFMSLLMLTATFAGPVQAAIYVGYTGKQWANDYGVVTGTCQADQLVKATEANTAADPLTATLKIGPPMNRLLGEKSPQSADLPIDSACFGHALELVPAGQRIHWVNPISGSIVHLILGNTSDTCRMFSGVTITTHEKKTFRGLACSREHGVWMVKKIQ
ncbi:hypothetical protein [Limnobacter sp.]|uniref:hypothetical protein n=1 Tax=Limnobacter sp. TaxID=2003368 RepID=UPI002E3198A9|nr:hypothetical protein [Limnobacter sp.]